MKKYFSKITALLIALVLIVGLVPSTFIKTVAADSSKLTVGVISDVHYYPYEMFQYDLDGFVEASKLNSTTSLYTEALVDNALHDYAEMAKTQGLKYVFIPGDLSKNGEYDSLLALAQRLREFESETGVQVLVINGNHDIRNERAAEFLEGEYDPVRWCEPEDFRNIFDDFGYDLADSFYTPPEGEQAGQLSYAATLEGGYRFIALDGGCYSSDNQSKGEDKGETRGNFTDGVMNWALEEIRKAKEQGLTVIGMTHFNLVEHYEHEDDTMQAFPIDNWQEVCEKLADAGMHFAFTGHLHLHDVSSWTSDNGEVMYDCATAALSVFPNYYRTVTFDNTSLDGTVTATYTTHDIDENRPISCYGTTYEKPFKYTSFKLNYGGDNLVDFAQRYLEYFLVHSIGPNIDKAGGLYNYLNKSFDIDSVIDNLLKNTNLGQAEGITKSSIKAVLKSVCRQLEAKFIDNPEYTKKVVGEALEKIINIEVSDKPCTKFIDTLGFGSRDRNGNVGDLISSCLAYMYLGDEDRSDDPFLNDALARFERGENAQEIFDTLVDVVLNDLLKDEILPAIKLDPLSFIGAVSEDQKLDILNKIMDVIGSPLSTVDSNIPKISAGDIVSFIFALGITDYKSLEDVLNKYLDEYMTESQMETIAYEFYDFIYDFTTDRGPKDLNVTCTYSGKQTVKPTVKDLRLPSGIAVTFGEDASTTRNISWFTKVGVTGTDIELVDYSKGPKFKGKATLSGSTIRTTREYPGIDLGVIGILAYKFNINQHVIKLTGLKPNTKYYYRVGDASRGWWSDVGVIETADNSNVFTFLHMSDSQGGIERQYNKWADTVNTAYKKFPNAKFIMHSGDQVDSGTNFRQWNWLFNTASNNLLSKPLMPTVGNHEKKGSALSNYFELSNVPSQDSETGLYYSYDYNNAHFIVLNTNDLNKDGTLSDGQLAWLKEDAQNSDKTWKILSLHKAVYSNGSHYDDKDVKGLRKQLSTLMPELGIDLVLQGHDHVYLRTDVLNNNKVVTTPKEKTYYGGQEYSTKIKPQGTIYTIDGCSGVKYYQTKDVKVTDSLFPRAEALHDATNPVFSAVQIDGDRLYFDAYEVDSSGNANRIDNFAIAKSDLTDEEKDPNNKLGQNNNGIKPGIHLSVPITSGDVLKVATVAVPVISLATIVYCVVKKRREKETE